MSAASPAHPRRGAGRVYVHAEPSAEVCRWIRVQEAEGKARRTVLERRTTMARMERDLGCPAVTAGAEQVTALDRPATGLSAHQHTLPAHPEILAVAAKMNRHGYWFPPPSGLRTWAAGRSPR